MEISFITGSENKFNEVNSILKDIKNLKLKQLNIDLQEIQEIDAKKIIEAKLLEASKHHKGNFIVEDTSLYLESLNGLPGPLIKWFMKTIGNDGIAKLAEKFENNNAQARTYIGLMHNKKITIFEGVIKGKIIKPKGNSNFGWDPIFQPLNHKLSFAEMSSEEKNKVSMRRLASEKLKTYLEKEKI